MDTQGNFYLGKRYDPVQAKLSDEPLLYDPQDLTTHGVVVGMTGSGKTGLCINLLEEAALAGIPALMIDPKGDITNLLLHFPDLLAQDFQPWINPDEARRAKKSLEQAAADAAQAWSNGLNEWGMDGERLRALNSAAHFAVYTPGSDAGLPVSIVASLRAPEIPWESNRELLRERIASTVTALLGLVGIGDADPVRSREHILLANIFENAWSQGQDLHLDELILRTQTPPFPKLGVFDVNTFFPEKDRFQLAMLLNNILAAPAFQTWIEGQPLDIPSLLYHPDGRPRHCVFYIAHLSDAERMFFVTLLFSAVETWMRTQSGTNSLRALLYFDEIFGYLPPTNNPPSKQPMLRMLKQARAYGVGLVLVTQNPVDVDYKGLSNAGTWFIGKLQTERDKARLLEGLESATASGMDRAKYDKLISGLGKRVFLMHNVHSKEPVVFQTRWAMNFLAGPLTRNQIPALNRLAGASLDSAALVSARQAVQPAASASAASPAASPVAPTILSAPARAVAPMAAPAALPASQPTIPPAPVVRQQAPGIGVASRPAIPSAVAEYFLPNNLTLSEAYHAAGSTPAPGSRSLGLIYYPTLLAQTRVRFINRRYNLDTEKLLTALVYAPDRRGVVRWEEFLSSPLDPARLDKQPAPEGRFMTPEAPFNDARMLKALERDFVDWAYRTSQVTVRSNAALKLFAGPNITSAEFRQMCADAARSARDAEFKKTGASLDRQIRTVEQKLGREIRELAEDEAEYRNRKNEEYGTHAENIFSFVTGRRNQRRVSSSLTKRRMTEQARSEVEESEKAIEDFKRQLAVLDAEKARLEQEIHARWAQVANQIDEINVAALKKDVLLDIYGIAWLPCYIIQIGNDTQALRAFQA